MVEEAGGAGDVSQQRLSELAAITVEMVDHIRQEIQMVDFWRNTHAQNVLRHQIVEFLDDRNVVSFSRLTAVADRVVELAKALHARLTSSAAP